MPGGLDLPCRDFVPRSEDAVLPQGTLQLQCAYSPGTGATPILHFDTEEPWPVRLTIFFDAMGMLHLGHRVSGQGIWLQLSPGLRGPAEGLILTYGWDAPARSGWLSLYDPDSGQLCSSEVHGPMPLSQRDGRRLCADMAGVKTGAEVSWMALADHLAPVGPMPGLGGATRIATPGGQKRRIDQIEPGHIVTTADGDTAQVRWAGSAQVIARGRQAPLGLRAPFHNLEQDIETSSDQRLILGGSDVEYLFGVEEVRASAGHLLDQRSVLRATQGRATARYWQLVLDRPAAILAEGCAVESFDPSPLIAAPEALALSVLSDLPRELMPLDRLPQTPILQGFEAMTLAYSGAA